MNEKPRWRVAFALVLVALATVPGYGRAAAHRQAVSVSIPSLHATGKERVVGFEIHITSGRIIRLSDVPIGWDVSINNDASWNAVARGSSTVGAAAVAPTFFNDFMIVEKDESLGIPFDAQGEVVVTEDFTTERRIKIGIKEFVTKKMAARRAAAPK